MAALLLALRPVDTTAAVNKKYISGGSQDYSLVVARAPAFACLKQIQEKPASVPLQIPKGNSQYQVKDTRKATAVEKYAFI